MKSIDKILRQAEDYLPPDILYGLNSDLLEREEKIVSIVLSENPFFEKISAERKRQDEKWGVDRDQHPSVWLTVLSEEVGEVAREICEADFCPENLTENYEKELVQVAAVALAALENIHKYKKEGK